MRTKVFVYPVSAGSLYLSLTVRGLEDRYEFLPRKGREINDAIDWAKTKRPTVLHIQWEEFVFRKYKSPKDADDSFASFNESLSKFVELGGRVVLTIHNELPHRITYQSQFLAVRQAAANASSAIIVHSTAARRVLLNQIAVDEAKIHVVPHPSYLGLYEPETVTSQALGTPPARVVLGFGAMRIQKGFRQLVEMLPLPFLQDIGARLQISGEGPEAGILQDSCRERTDVQWDIRYVPHAEAAALIRSAICVPLVYERFLTSGLAHLVISVGGLYIAADAPQHRELLPEISHKFLFRPNDEADFRRTVRLVDGLTPAERKQAVQANFETARRLRPEGIAARIGDIYDRLT